MKKTYFVLYPFKFRSFDEKRFEFDLLKKNKNKVIIFEFLNIFYPHFKKAYIKERVKNVIKIKSLLHFYITFKKLILSNENIVIFDFLKNDSFKSFLIKFFLQFFNLKNVSFFNPGISTFDKGVTSDKIKLHKKIYLLLKRPNETLSKFKGKFIDIISLIFRVNDDFVFVAGESCLKNLKSKQKYCKFIKGHSWDISNIYARKTIRIIRDKYAVYLDSPGPKFLSDSFLLKEKMYETCSHTYPLLRKFFNKMEKDYNLKIVVCPHPKTRIKDRSGLFGYRRVINGHTHDLIKNSSFIITRNSTAVSYACYYKKPILLFYTNETKNTVSQRMTLIMAKSLNCNAVNLDKVVNKKKKILLKKNIKKYKDYLYRYCTFKNLEMSNSQIWKEHDFSK